MTDSDQIHPLGNEETGQINPAVADGLTPEQIDFLCRQSTVVGRKKLQILRRHSLSGSASIWSIVLPRLCLRIRFDTPLRSLCTGILRKLQSQKRIFVLAVPRSHEILVHCLANNGDVTIICETVHRVSQRKNW